MRNQDQLIELSNVEKRVHLKCQVIGYQFPERWRDDWCLLEVNVTQGEYNFKRVDPALETTELVRLHQWFKCLSERRLPKFANLSFTEPCISFQFLGCTDEDVRISIQLGYELKSNFEIEQLGINNDNWKIVFTLNDRDFEGVLDGISQTLIAYPIRGNS